MYRESELYCHLMLIYGVGLRKHIFPLANFNELPIPYMGVMLQKAGATPHIGVVYDFLTSIGPY